MGQPLCFGSLSEIPKSWHPRMSIPWKPCQLQKPIWCWEEVAARSGRGCARFHPEIVVLESGYVGFESPDSMFVIQLYGTTCCAMLYIHQFWRTVSCCLGTKQKKKCVPVPFFRRWGVVRTSWTWEKRSWGPMVSLKLSFDLVVTAKVDGVDGRCNTMQHHYHRLSDICFSELKTSI